MSISWRLKTYIGKNHGIYRPVDFQRLIIEKTGVIISVQQICNLLGGAPDSVRLKTMEVICSSLNCSLSAICEVNPSGKKLSTPQKLSFKNTPHSKRGVKQFPNPEDYR
jgi:DNA-binding Xre family transcriptional regulator